MYILEELLRAAVNQYISNITEDEEITAELDGDFAYYNSLKLIAYALVVPEESTLDFYAAVAQIAEEKDIIHLLPKVDVFLLSLLHEVGHYMTRESITVDANVRRRILASLRQEEDLEERQLLVNAYYRLPSERAANVWMLDYIVTHIEEICHINFIFNTIIQKYFDSKGIT